MKNIKWSHELRKRMYTELRSHTGIYVNQSKADLCKFSKQIAIFLFNDVSKHQAIEFQIKQCLRSHNNSKTIDYKTIVKNRIAAIDAQFLSASQVSMMNEKIDF